MRCPAEQHWGRRCLRCLKTDREELHLPECHPAPKTIATYRVKLSNPALAAGVFGWIKEFRALIELRSRGNQAYIVEMLMILPASCCFILAPSFCVVRA